MRVIYIDIDSLRPGHLWCYGCKSANIDLLLQNALHFDNFYASDAPYLPSRTALWSGRFSFNTGEAALEVIIEGLSEGRYTHLQTTEGERESRVGMYEAPGESIELSLPARSIHILTSVGREISN